MAGFGPPGMGNWSSTSGLPRPGAMPKPPKLSASAFNQRFNATFNQKFAQAFRAKQAGNGPPRPQGAANAGAQPGAAQPAQPAPQQPVQGSPLDATYFANVNANQFKTNNAINQANLTGSQDLTALQAALGQLAYQQPRAQLALEQKANAGGGLYSSVYDQNLGNLNQQFLTRQTAAQTRYSDAMSQIAARIAGLQGDVPLYDQAQALASTQRQSQQAAANPAYGALTPDQFNALFNAQFNQRFAQKAQTRRGRGRR